MKRLIIVVMLFLFSSGAQAEILFQDPTGKALNDAFDSLSEKEVKDISLPGIGRKKYLLGLLYLNGDKEFRVEKNCEESFKLLNDASKRGISDAKYALATMYYHGVCTKKNINQARGLSTQAAQEGYILAQRMLGLAYVGEKWEELYPYDLEEGIYWLRKAGNAGDGRSAGQLAYMYRKGEEVPRDDKKSFVWLKKGIFNKYEKGSGIGFPVLAERYEKGVGTEVDLVKAYKYYDLIGTAGIESKQRISKKMTQEQIDEALRQSQAWQEEHNVQIGGGWIQYK